MKKIAALVLALCMALSLAACGGGAPAADSGAAAAGTFESEGRQYITAGQLKADIEAGEDMFLLDIQLEDAYNTAHLYGAVATYAFPVDTDEAKAKVDAVLGGAEGKPLIIICPGGKGGANNTWDYLSSIQYDMSSAFILENGQNGWPFPELLASGGGASPAVASAAAVGANKIYVTPEWIKSVIDGEQPQSGNYVIIEGSWGEPGEEYLAAHIPGAVHMNSDTIEEEEYWNIRTPEEITQVMKDYGITKDTAVIVYGNDSAATRIAFVCFWAGVNEVHVLDGGFSVWTSAGLETEAGNVAPAPTDEDFGVGIPARPQYLQSMPDEVIQAQADDDYRLVSIRSWEEFTGETSGYGYIDRAGEPAGAVWGHDEGDYYKAGGGIKDFSEIEAMLAEWDVTGDDTVAFYCGTGWRATVP
jgi:thiosulfate/3-mercaptopyruvate sulfurtransferase